MNDARLRELERYAQAARTLEGWQLEYEPEPLVPGPPWDYEARAGELASKSAAMLDLGTGGGEILSRVLAGSNARAVASEEWHVNAPVAKRCLAQRAPIVRASSLALPFADASFDLVLSRHEALDPAEVARVLAPGGRLLTQQMIHDLWHELREVFPDLARFPDHSMEYPRGLEAAGMRVEDTREFRRPTRFRELGHLVYHLVAAPWTVPGFSVASHREALEELERWSQRDEGLQLTEGFTLLEARR